MRNCIDNQIQYIGLNSYSESQKDIFWGRDNEIERITSSIFSNESTIIFGPSGSGKTSLMNAGVIPTLRESQFIPIRVTPKNCIDNGKLLLWETISEKIAEQINEHNLNITSGNDFLNCSLYETLYNSSYEDQYGFDVYFLIIIDQFEEIFQLNLNLKEIQIVFDAYEELCGYSQQAKFIKTDIYTSSNFNHRFVLIVRQDYMFELESNAFRYPLLYQNRICVNKLNEEQAFKIITSSKDSNAESLFSKDDAINIIKDLTNRADFSIDGIPEIEVDSMMLSLYLFEICNNEHHEYDINIDKSFDVIKDFYMRNMEVEGIELLEKQLVSSDGRHRKPVLYKDCIEMVEEDELRRIVLCGIFDAYSQNGIDWIRLRHDKLCQYAMMHIQAIQTKSLIIQRNRPTKFLNQFFRVSHNNSYSSVTLQNPDNNNFSQLLNFYFNKQNSFYSIGIEEGIEKNQTNCTIDIKSYDKKGGVKSENDGIDTVSISYTEGKLYKLSFFKQNKPHALYFGVHCIYFYYDNKRRPILYDYYDTSGTRISVEDGYSSILFMYDDDNMNRPSYTYYLKIPSEVDIIKEFGSPKKVSFIERALKYKTMHIDGNHGYHSKYDSSFCEEARIFVDGNDKEIILNDGYSRIIMETDNQENLLSIAFYKFNQKSTGKNQHFHKIIYNYNSTKRLLQSVDFYDENGEKISDVDGNYGLINHIEDNLIYQLKVDINGKSNPDKNGLLAQCLSFNENFQLEWISNIHEDNLYTPNTDNNSILMIYNQNNKVEWNIDLDADNSIKCINQILYDDKLRLCNSRFFDKYYNLTKNQIIERIDNKEIIKTFDIYGYLIEDESFERVKLNSNSYFSECDGREYIEIKDSQGNTIITYRCNEKYEHIEDENGVWENHYEYKDNKLYKEYYVNKEGKLLEITSGIYGFEYDDSQGVQKIYNLLSNGKRDEHCVKYQYKSLMIDTVDFDYIDEVNNIPTTAKDSLVFSLKSRQINESTVVQEFLDSSGTLCNGKEGWAIKELVYGSHIKYFDSQKNPVIGPEGWHAYVTRDQILTMDIEYMYLDTSGKLIENEYGIAAFLIKKVGFLKKLRLALTNRSSDFLNLDLLFEADFYNKDGKTLNTDNCRPYLYLYSKKKCQELKYIYDDKTSKIELKDTKMWLLSSSSYNNHHSCVIIKEKVDDFSFKEGDIIIKFGSWCAFDYFNIEAKKVNKETKLNLIASFESTFKQVQSTEQYVSIVFARLENFKWIVRRVRLKLQKNNPSIGRIVDAEITLKDYRYIFNEYEKLNQENHDIELIAKTAIKKASEISKKQNKNLRQILKDYQN